MGRTAYKFVTAEVADLYLAGNVLIRPLSYYRKAVDQGGVGDPTEASLISQSAGTQLLRRGARNNPASTMIRGTGELSVSGIEFRHQYDAYVWCGSLLPPWSKDASQAARCINARAETVDTLASFRNAFRSRRCLVLASGFYEWRKISPKEKQPHYITAKESKPFAFAGLWERWKPKDGSPAVETAAIITTDANELLRALHDRMPVILDQADISKWLGEIPATPDELKAMLKPYPSDKMQLWPVDKSVGSVKNDQPELVMPIGA